MKPPKSRIDSPSCWYHTKASRSDWNVLNLLKWPFHMPNFTAVTRWNGVTVKIGNWASHKASCTKPRRGRLKHYYYSNRYLQYAKLSLHKTNSVNVSPLRDNTTEMKNWLLAPFAPYHYVMRQTEIFLLYWLTYLMWQTFMS